MFVACGLYSIQKYLYSWALMVSGSGSKVYVAYGCNAEPLEISMQAVQALIKAYWQKDGLLIAFQCGALAEGLQRLKQNLAGKAFWRVPFAFEDEEGGGRMT